MLTLENVNKSYGKVKALDHLNLNINQGEIYGFVGPNGAGKTTAMKIAAGLLLPDSGKVKIGGIDGVKYNAKIKEKIGYIPDSFGVYDNLKVIEYMEFFGSIYELKGIDIRQLSYELLDLVHISHKAEEYVDHLSRGMKQKLCLARSLIHNPDLLIFDEPATGLDPRARFEMKEILKTLSGKGKTILISSHVLSDLAKMCTNIGIIDQGKMIITGTVEHIFQKMESANPLVIKIAKNQKRAIDLLKKNPYVDNIAIQDNNISITFTGNEQEEAKLLAGFIEEGVRVSSFTREAGNLESLFLQITAGGRNCKEVELRTKPQSSNET